MMVGTGRVHTFAEEDYRFGAGPLLMVIETVGWNTPSIQDGEMWCEIRGVEMAADGRVIGPRRALVRRSRLSSLNQRNQH